MILILGVFLSVFQTSVSMYFVLYKKLHILVYINIIAFIVNIFGNLYISSFGIKAAAISTLCAYLILSFGQIIFLAKQKLL